VVKKERMRAITDFFKPLHHRMHGSERRNLVPFRGLVQGVGLGE
jgi:hypothetical protein